MAESALDSIEDVAVVVFAKAPRAGRVKTRMGASIGEERATALYRCFLDDIAEQVGALADELDQPVSPLLAYAGDPQHEGFGGFRDAGFALIEQRGPDLGARLRSVVERCFAAAAKRVIIIGTDSPTLLQRHFRAALDALEHNDVVVGPSFDGGYYMIGLDAPHTSVFDNIEWSTPQVYGQTLRHARAAGLLCESLEFWYDADTIADLKLLKTHLFDYLRYRQPHVARRTAEFIEELDEQGVWDWHVTCDD
ncbi:MAG: TIGR04282 family arsenosugar biosynthesis glycosyltransferase [Persicimonas sp.]